MVYDISKYIIRKGYEKEDKIVAQNFYEMWIDIGMTNDDIDENWMEIILNKIKKDRYELKLTTIVVVDVNNNEEKIIGSAVCQIYNTNSLHPHIIKYTTLQTGYIWGVYVKPEYRNTEIKELEKNLLKNVIIIVKKLVVQKLNYGHQIKENMYINIMDMIL